MLTDSDKQVAALAVSRYGADRTRVSEVLAALRRAPVPGRPADFLDALVESHLLTSAQARQLRFALGDTQIDLGRKEGAMNGDVACDIEDIIGPSTGMDVRVLGDYRILALLGEGGMGTVYRAYHEADDRYVAIKVLSDYLARNQNYLERFHREAQNVARLNHPNIVRSLGAGHDTLTDKHYLVLEYVDGESAQSLLERLGSLAVGDAVHIALEIARALEHAHSRRIVHRDIKPDNVLLTKSGVAKLSDLGLAKQMGEANSLTATRQGFGTPYYMPYEQAINAKKADGRSDIFALGATLYHLLTGEVPFPGDSHLEIVEKKELGDFAPASSHIAGIPPELDSIVAKMMARRPEDRYPTASELIVALERTRLAAPVPSFVDSEVALRDPVVRARLTAPAQPTQPDLSVEGKRQAKINGTANYWYLRYQNREGRPVKSRLTTEEVRDRLERGRLTPAVQAAREPAGEFRRLEEYPEFRPAGPDTVNAGEVETQSLAKPAPREAAEEKATRFVPAARRWSWPASLLAVVGLGGGALLVWQWFLR